MMNKNLLHNPSGEYTIGLLSLGILIGIDLYTKYLFYDLQLYKNSYWIEPAMNMGVSFSWMIPYTIVIPLSLFALVGFFYLYHHKAFSKIVTLLLIAGTLGNVYDRLLHDGVRDFLVMPNLFIYNVADIFLFFGIVVALIHTIRKSS